jgi:Predicted RNA-binding protein (contains PUA domain)
MFHKEGSFHKVQGKKLNDTPINKSQRKKLRESFLNSIVSSSSSSSPLATAQLSPDLVNYIFLHPNSDISIRKIKLQGATSKAGATCIYSRSPTVFETNSNADKHSLAAAAIPWPYTRCSQVLLLQVGQILLPSLALLSVLPKHVLEELPTVMVHPIVSKYLCRGADLMRSGMVSISPKHDGWVVIRAVRNPQPFAVGFVTRGDDETSIGLEKKGGGVQIVTCYGDDIYRSQMMMSSSAPQVASLADGGVRSEMGGDIYDFGNYGNVGFVQGKQVYGLRNTSSSGHSGSDMSSEEDEDDEEQVKGDQGESEQETGEGKEDNHGQEMIAQGEQNVMSESDELKDAMKEIAIDASEVEEQEKMDDPETILLEAFHNAAVRISKNQLPMPTSTFYSQHILPARKEGTLIDLKATRYKKLGPFLLEQAQKGIITVGASNGDAVAFLKSIDRSHIDLREARQRKREETENGNTKNDATQTGRKKTALVNLYIIPHSIVSHMRLCDDDVKAMNAKSEERRGTGYLTAPECRDILNRYVKDNDLFDEFDPEMVRLDGPLCDSLFRKTKKQLQNDELGVNEYPESVTRKELNNLWLKKMDKAYAIVSLPGSCITSMKRGDAPKISFFVEARQSKKKFITRVRGLEEVSMRNMQIVDF